jgi:hypothetical protein
MIPRNNREDFLTILKGQIVEMIDHAAAHDPVIAEEVSRDIGPMMKEVESSFLPCPRKKRTAF